MNKQPEALRLAECLDDVTFTTRGQATDAAAELRRLYAEVERLNLYAAGADGLIEVWKGRAQDFMNSRDRLLKANHSLWERLDRLQAEVGQPPALEQPQCGQEQEPVAWLHQCNKRPDLVKLSFSKREPVLTAKGYKARPLILGDIARQLPKREPLTDEQIAAATGVKPGTPLWLVAASFIRAAEAAHNIK